MAKLQDRIIAIFEEHKEQVDVLPAMAEVDINYNFLNELEEATKKLIINTLNECLLISEGNKAEIDKVIVILSDTYSDVYDEDESYDNYYEDHNHD